MKYFIDVVNFVDKHLIWVVLAFLAVCVVEFFVFLFMKKGGKFNTDGLFICISTDLVITLGLYVLACLGVGVVNCIKDQDWHFWANYMNFLQGDAGGTVFGIIFFVALIVAFFCLGDIDSFIARIIVTVLAAALGTFLAVVLGFVLYVIVAFLIVVVKIVWFVISGFFQSIFQFIIKYWKMSVVVLSGPGVLFGACCALINYVKSFRDEIIRR